jgi:hypothetical protein
MSMGAPKVLIDAQWRPDHFAAPVAPAFKAVPLANRKVPSVPAVSFIKVMASSTTVRAEGGHKLFLLRSIAQDPVKLTQFIPKEAAKSNPVEGSLQCVHGHMGIIIPLPPSSWPSPPLPGAINCGVLLSKDVQCLANLENMAKLLAQRMVDELIDDPFAFFNNFQEAKMASNMEWATNLPGRIGDGIAETAGVIWDGACWVAGKAWDNAVALYEDPKGAIIKAIARKAMTAYNVGNAVITGAQVLKDPKKRKEIMNAIEDWVKESFSDIACEMADAIMEMLRSNKPLAAQLGEVDAIIEQKRAEIAATIAVSVLGDKGLSKLALLAKAGKLGNSSVGKLFERIKGAMKKKSDGKPSAKGETPNRNNQANTTKQGEAQQSEQAGGAKGVPAQIACPRC